MKTIKILFVFALFTTLVFSSCTRSLFCKSGKGEVVDMVLDIPEFENFVMSGSFNTEIIRGDEFSVIARGHENIIADLNTRVIGNTWNAKLGRTCYINYELTLYITVPEIKKLTLEGSGDIFLYGEFLQETFSASILGSGNILSENRIVCNDVKLDITGSGDIDLLVSANTVDANITGSGNIFLSGSAHEQSVRILGSGNYKTAAMESSHAKVSIIGSGDAYLNVNESLDIRIDGSGDVYYIGYPVIDSKGFGTGRVINSN